MSHALQDLSLGDQFIHSHGSSLLVSFGFEKDSPVYLFSSYVIKEVQLYYGHFNQVEASISISCAGPTMQSSMSNLDLDLRAARDLSVDELMKVVYDKLQQRSES